VDPDRFGDVSSRFLEHPDAQPPRPPRRRRRALAAIGVAAVSAGALAAGASALGGGEGAAPPAKRAVPGTEGGWTAYAPLNAHRAGHGPCHHGQDRSSPSSAATGPRT
jgi:hypothetical protein